MLRSLVPAVLVLLTGPAAAHAALADRYVPFYDAADGVRAGRDEVRFDAKAAALYRRTLAGRRVTVRCQTVPARTSTSAAPPGR
ncbi:hypothetical protein DVA67_019410 [Solirubrobacter sp. CPCC 204708]|uniref:Uncharacterized protein n=1 Tax=Solirubrobacter deserti TaxID=2282478 RepID=A0ABT4RFX5_9ACTN|nr:hypothetical protein [Solirubrobacter deserti]MBE2318158.1 hypothetical protein [Solirubrobacter deserti]MDA0137439.1 hypothetical protein [Solirubrobacter deserti]